MTVNVKYGVMWATINCIWWREKCHHCLGETSSRTLTWNKPKSRCCPLRVVHLPKKSSLTDTQRRLRTTWATWSHFVLTWVWRMVPHLDFIVLTLCDLLSKTVGCELDSLEEAGILHKIYRLQWLGCITCPCPGRTLLLSDDYKVTINLVLQVDQYPLPNPSELLVSLTGGKWLTKLDLTSAYQQMLLDGESTKSVTIKMYQGLYEYTRLSFDVVSALAVF